MRSILEIVTLNKIKLVKISLYLTDIFFLYEIGGNSISCMMHWILYSLFMSAMLVTLF